VKTLKIIASKNILEGSVELPLSKSISNRGLMISALSGGSVKNEKISEADDTLLLDKLLKQIKAGSDHHVHCQNAGTVIRFLTAYLAITPGAWTLDGDYRMRQRPIGPLVDALKSLGGEIEYEGRGGYPPLKIEGKKLEGGSTFIDSAISSQFISALMMIGPLLENGLTLLSYGSPASLPYIYMTENMMKKAGAEIDIDLPEIKIRGNRYKGGLLPYESDWSAAAFWYELMALSKGGELLLHGLKEDSIQGDSVAAKYFYMFGVETIFKPEGALIRKNFWMAEGFNFILIEHPDLFPAMVVTTAAKGLEGNFYEIEGLRIKESDRPQALASELLKCGIKCSMEENLLSFKEQKINISKPIDTYNDHRIAMAFAPLAVLGSPITINNPEVVSKSYPNFWSELQKVLGVGF